MARVRPISVALLLSAGAVMPVFLGGTLAVQLTASIGLDELGLGLALSAFFAAGGVTSSFSGGVIDRVGWRRGVRLTALVSVTSLLAIALFARSFPSLVAGMAIGGLGAGIGGPTSGLVLLQEVPGRRMGLAYGLWQSAIPLASMIAGASIPLIALRIGWRWAFAIAVIVPVAALLANPPRRTSPIHDADPQTEPRMNTLRTRSGSATDTVGSLVPLAAAAAVGTFALGGLNAFGVASSVRAGLDEGIAGLLVAASSLLGITVRLGFGWSVDRRIASDGFRDAAFLLVLGAAGFFLLSSDAEPLVTLGLVLGYGAGWSWVGLFLYGVVSHRFETPARSLGFVQAGTALGMALGPVGFGAIVRAIGYERAWPLLAIFPATAAVLMLFGARRLGRA